MSDISGIQMAETNLVFGHYSNNGLKMAGIEIETAPSSSPQNTGHKNVWNSNVWRLKENYVGGATC